MLTQVHALAKYVYALGMFGPQVSAREPSQMGQKDCQREAREAFEKLCSWREQSQNQFTDIINSYSNRISRGISDLAEKVGEQQTELLVIRKERDVLLEAVNNLNVEIRHLNAKFPKSNPPDEQFEHDTQVLDNLEEDIQNATEQDEETQTIKSEPGYEDALLVQGSTNRRALGCVNAAGKLRQKW